MGEGKPYKSILDTKIAVPLVFKFLTTILICVMSTPVALVGEKAMVLLFIYPLDLLFSVLILVLNQKEKPLNIVTLSCVIMMPILLLIWIPVEIISIDALHVFSKYWRELGFWGGIITIMLLITDIIRFRYYGKEKEG